MVPGTTWCHDVEENDMVGDRIFMSGWLSVTGNVCDDRIFMSGWFENFRNIYEWLVWKFYDWL